MTAIHVYNGFISVLDVSKKNKIISFSNEKIFYDKKEAHKYLKSKKNIHIIFETENLIEETISLHENVKKEKVLKTAVASKIRKFSNNVEPLIINHISKEKDEHSHNMIHTFETIEEKYVLELLEWIPSLENVKHIYTEQHALFFLSQEIYKDKSYIMAYIQEKKNTVVVVDKNKILFTRTWSFNEFELDLDEKVLDIERSMLYVSQQFRNIDFEFLSIFSDFYELNEDFLEKFKSVYKNIIIFKNPKITEENKNYFLNIGALIEDKRNLLPSKIHSEKLLHKGLIFSLIVSSIFGLYSLNNLIETTTLLLDEKEKAENLKISEERILKELQNINFEDVSKKENLLSLSISLPQDAISNMVYVYPFIKEIKPNNTEYYSDKDKSELILSFERKFSTLKEFNTFEELFQITQKKIPLSEKFGISVSYSHDYKSLFFKSKLVVNELKESDLSIGLTEIPGEQK